MKIEYFEIKGLFGDIDYKIELDNNRLILVAENGSGKTTIVNIIYYFLSRQWGKLLRYKFSSITAKVNGETIMIDKSELDSEMSRSTLQRQMRRFPISVRSELERYIARDDIADIYQNPSKLRLIAENLGVPRHLLSEMLDDFAFRQASLFVDSHKQKDGTLKDQIDCQILYLPTYRRIEQELKVIFPDLESDIEKYSNRKRHTEATPKEGGYIELVEFGMEDVEVKIRRKLRGLHEDLNNKIRNNLAGGYLRDVINKKYLNISYEDMNELDEKGLNSMLDRIEDTVLSKIEKNKLVAFVKHINDEGALEKDETKIIAYFIFRLLEIYNELKLQEKDVEQFVSICNDYSSNKTFVYDNINFEIKIRPLRNGRIRKGEEIELRDLSSGEKQIVSLFSHLFLSQNQDFFIVIDEPELSLSVPWQERFLVDVVGSPYCKGILAVTHSPFIFDNSLEKSAHALSEYIVKTPKK